jgi:hypothetical protein
MLLLLSGIIIYWLMCRPIAWLLAKPLLWTLLWTGALLLWPTGSINAKLRSHGGHILPGSHVYEGLVSGILRLVDSGLTWAARRLDSLWHAQRGQSVLLIFLIAAVPATAWFVRPALHESSAGQLIDKVIAQWNSFEHAVLTTAPTVSAQVAPSNRSKAPDLRVSGSLEPTTAAELPCRSGQVRGTGTLGLRLRDSPNGQRLGNLPEGTLVCVLSEPHFETNQEWIQVQVVEGSQGRAGWVASRYIVIDQ